MNEGKNRKIGPIHLAFGHDVMTLPIAAIVPLKTLPEGSWASLSYARILGSIKTIGLIEAPVVVADIGEALNLQVESVLWRLRLLEGTSPEAAEIPKDTPCSMKVFDILRQMAPVRQIDTADLMSGRTTSSPYLSARYAPPPVKANLPASKRARAAGNPHHSGQHIAPNGTRNWPRFRPK